MAKAAKTKGIGIKYTDKSAGQPELVPIFKKLVRQLKAHAGGNLKLRGGKDGQIALVTGKPVVIDGKEREEMWFAAALVQKGYVGFYYMATGPKLGPQLMKCLKGKSCFHIKKDDPIIFDQIEEALRLGVELYQTKGWI